MTNVTLPSSLVRGDYYTVTWAWRYYSLISISLSCPAPQTITGTSTRTTCTASSRPSPRTTSRSSRACRPHSCSSSTATWSWSRCTCSTHPWRPPTPALATRCVRGHPARPGPAQPAACGEAGASQEADAGSYSTRLPASQHQRRPEPQRPPPDPPTDPVTPHPLSPRNNPRVPTDPPEPEGPALGTSRAPFADPSRIRHPSPCTLTSTDLYGPSSSPATLTPVSDLH